MDSSVARSVPDNNMEMEGESQSTSETNSPNGRVKMRAYIKVDPSNSGQTFGGPPPANVTDNLVNVSINFLEQYVSPNNRGNAEEPEERVNKWFAYFKSARTPTKQEKVPSSHEDDTPTGDDDDQCDGRKPSTSKKCFTELSSGNGVCEPDIPDGIVNEPEPPVDVHEPHPGSLSPPSSQGSMSSTEYLDSHVERIKKDSEQCKELMQDLRLVFPNKQQHDIFLKYVKDKSFAQRQLRFLCCDFESYLISSGKQVEDPGNCAELLKTLQAGETSIIFPRVGKALIDNYCGAGQSQSTSTFQDQAKAAATIVLQPPFDNAQTADVIESPFDRSGYNADLLFETPNTAIMENHNRSEEESTNMDNFDIVLNPNRSQEDEAILNNMLESANDRIKGQKEKSKKIEKAGQVLFVLIFTRKEIQECTLSGKNGSRPFPEQKLRFINQAICWLLESPPRRTISDLEKSIAENDERLSLDDDYPTLKTKVFTEFAHRQRTMYSNSEKRKSEEKVESKAKKAKRQ